MSGRDTTAAMNGNVVNAMTVDVEDYFQVSAFDDIVSRSAWDQMESRVSANTRRLLDVFDAFDVRGTFFVLGWVAERQPALVREIAARGHEIASHGYAHRLIYNQSPAEFRDDVRRAKQLLEDVTGVSVAGYRAPRFSMTTRSFWALAILIEEGYLYDASIFPIRHDRYGIPGSPRHPYNIQSGPGSIMEVPGSTIRIGPLNLPIGGGGYFRIFPYPLTRWGIAHVNRVEQQPTVFYIHPWEIDPDQPRIASAPLKSRLRHYSKLSSMEGKLLKLLRSHAWGRTDQVVAAELARLR